MIYLHIGTHKTGSKSIQLFCSKHQDWLSAHGISFYRGIHVNPTNHTELHLASLREGRDSFARLRWPEARGSLYFKQVANSVDAFLASRKTPDALFSNEDLSFIRYPDECERLRRLFQKHTDEFTILLYLRNKQDFRRSFRDQIHKIPDRVPSANPRSALYLGGNSWLFDYDSLIRVFSERFGKKNVIVLDYDHECIRHESVVASFVSAIGLPSTELEDATRIRVHETPVSALDRNGTSTLDGAASCQSEASLAAAACLSLPVYSLLSNKRCAEVVGVWHASAYARQDFTRTPRDSRAAMFRALSRCSFSSISDSALLATRVSGDEKIVDTKRLSKVEDHLHHLARLFASETQILYFHAVLISLIRRRLYEKAPLVAFFSLWTRQGDYLLRNLSLRWLVSAADTWIDQSPSRVDASTATVAAVIANTTKLYETERRIIDTRHSTAPWPGRQIPVDEARSLSGQELFDGVTPFVVGSGDMISNMIHRMQNLKGTHPYPKRIVEEIFNRLATHDTVFARFLARHHGSDTFW